MSDSAFFHEESMMVGGMNINDWYAFNDSSVMGFDASPDPHAHIKNNDDDRRASICSLGASSRDQYSSSSGSDDDDDTTSSPFSEDDETPVPKECEEEAVPTTKRGSDFSSSSSTAIPTRRKPAPPRRTLSGGKVWKSLRGFGGTTNKDKVEEKEEQLHAADQHHQKHRGSGRAGGLKKSSSFKLKKSSSFKWIKKTAASA